MVDPISEKTWDAFTAALETHAVADNTTMEETVRAITRALSSGDPSAFIGRSEQAQRLAMRELHHRIGNELSTLQGVMRLRSRDAAPSSRSLPCASCITQVGAVAQLHAILNADNPATDVELLGFFGLVCDLFRGSNVLGDRVVIEARGDRMRVPHAVANALSLIVNEALTNAVKHAFPDRAKGWIRVVVQRTGASGGRVVVSDSGGSGPSGAPHGGSGLRLMHRLAEQIGAELSAEPDRDGFTIVCDFSLPERSTGQRGDAGLPEESRRSA